MIKKVLKMWQLVGTILATILLLNNNFNCVQAGSVSRLDEDGGYNLIVAPEWNAPQDFNVFTKDYVTRIEEGLNRFSKALFKATGKFFIKTVQIAIPDHWDDEDVPREDLTIYGCQNADICLMKEGDFVHVENPSHCGLPGERILVPLDFFESNETLPHGLPEKTLLKAWARYRWGTWEEHGFPDDDRFPYAYRKYTDHSFVSWEPTGCFKDGHIDGNRTCLDEADELMEPETECRFYPDSELSNTSTSLGFMHWLDSVDMFCAESTHVKNAPNRQNILCGYRSIMEVMGNSSDYAKAIKQPPANLTVEYKRLAWQSYKPLLYILIDTQFKPTTPKPVLVQIVEGMKNLFDDENGYMENVLVKITKFPGSKGQYSETLKDWGKFSNDSAIEMEEFFGALYPEPDAKLDGFIYALDQAVDEVKVINHPGGAVILVLKDGGYPDSFDTHIFESEISAIISQEKIIVSALEVQANIVHPKTHLKNIVEASGGLYSKVTPAQDAGISTRDVVQRLPEYFALGIDKSEDTQRHILIQRYLDNEGTVEIPVHNTNLARGKNITLTLTMIGNSESGSYQLENCVGSKYNISLNKPEVRSEWEESAGQYKRLVQEYKFLVGPPNTPDPCVKYSGSCKECNISKAHFLVTYETNPELAGDTMDTEIYFTIPEGLWNHTKYWELGSAGFKVYAKLTIGANPVVGVTGVNAYFQEIYTKVTYGPFPLEDSGAGSVDAVRGDGIYSGIANPRIGYYHLWVEVSSGAMQRNGMYSCPHRNSAVNRLITQDQEEIGCPKWDDNCVAIGMNRRRAYAKRFAKTAIIRSYIPVPMNMSVARITNLTATPVEDFHVTLQWPIPPVFEPPLRGVRYEIRYSKSPEDLQTNSTFQRSEYLTTVNCASANNGICSVLSTISVPTDAHVMYFGLRAVNSANESLSLPSNVAEAKIEEHPPTEATTTPGAGDRDSTTPSESPVTTDNTESTASTSEPSTTEEDILHWYEETEATLMFAVFGSAVALLAVLAILYSCCKAKIQARNERLGRRSKTSSMQTLHEEHIY